MKVLVAQLCLTLCDPMDYSPLGSSVHGILQKECWSGLSCPSPGDLPDPGVKPVSPVSLALRADSLPLSHLGSPTNLNFLFPTNLNPCSSLKPKPSSPLPPAFNTCRYPCQEPICPCWLSPILLVSLGCHNRVSHTGWL